MYKRKLFFKLEIYKEDKKASILNKFIESIIDK